MYRNVSSELELVTGNQLTDASFFDLLVRTFSGAGSSEISLWITRLCCILGVILSSRKVVLEITECANVGLV